MGTLPAKRIFLPPSHQSSGQENFASCKESVGEFRAWEAPETLKDWPSRRGFSKPVPRVCVAPAVAPWFVYFGTGGPGAKGIYRATFDAANGKLSAAELAAEIGSPGFLALHPGWKETGSSGGWSGRGFNGEGVEFVVAELGERARGPLDTAILALESWALPNDPKNDAL